MLVKIRGGSCWLLCSSQKEWLVISRCFCLFVIKWMFTNVLSLIKSWLQFRIHYNFPNYPAFDHLFLSRWLCPSFFFRKSSPSKKRFFFFFPPSFYPFHLNFSQNPFLGRESSLFSLTKPICVFLLASIYLTVLFLLPTNLLGLLILSLFLEPITHFFSLSNMKE